MATGDITTTVSEDCCGCGDVTACNCSGCDPVTLPLRVRLTHLAFDNTAGGGADCGSFDWSPTDQCLDFFCTPGGASVVGDSGGGTFTVDGQEFTVSWGAAIRCELSGGHHHVRLYLDLIVTFGGGCAEAGIPVVLALNAIFGDVDCDDGGHTADLLGTYSVNDPVTDPGNAWSYTFALESGACP